ncbi:putative nonphototropic hypocotyl protein 1 [Rosellinia necatrix]|uniref:Putative nonphototropic hypocotyl protein 1 n=1 Tax=Rosellinia necatrix TaxID=77044 RepID=A0A1W2TQQ7_ROSNE|nr:putative nonphototropic hypocotyl protein 1 [Rosellinia necatrix]
MPNQHANDSPEFHRATQYGRRFAFGRNCRFLQGPKTNQHSIHRLREMLVMGKEHCEPLLNYRRDGSVFMNLLMITPLYDNRGKVRYHLGAQVDVSGLLKECAGLASLAELVAQRQHQASQASSANDSHDDDTKETRTSRDALSDLAEMFSLGELKMVQAPSGGAKPNSSSKSSTSPRPPPSPTRGESAPAVTATVTAAEEALTDNSISSSMAQLTSNSSLAAPNHRARGILDHYLLVRPAPSLRILFASPSLRVPGILQSPLLARIGGPPCVRDAVARALRDGDGVTAKVRWLARPAGSSASSTSHPNPNNPNPNPNLNPNAGTGAGVTVHGRNRWIHATPLLGVDGTVGVWMVILIDDEEKRRGLGAPPVEACNLERRRPFDVQIGADRLSQGNKSASEAGDEDRPAEADGAAAGRDDVGGPEIGAAHTRGAV